MLEDDGNFKGERWAMGGGLWTMGGGRRVICAVGDLGVPFGSGNMRQLFL
jgi:hypothetical protein